jgi:hypothetical protein
VTSCSLGDRRKNFIVKFFSVVIMYLQVEKILCKYMSHLQILLAIKRKIFWKKNYSFYYIILYYIKIVHSFSPVNYFFLWLYSSVWALAASTKLSTSLQLLDLGESVWLLGRVIISSQGLYLYINTENRTHNSNTEHPSPGWDSNQRSQCPRERRQFML